MSVRNSALTKLARDCLTRIESQGMPLGTSFGVMRSALDRLAPRWNGAARGVDFALYCIELYGLDELRRLALGRGTKMPEVGMEPHRGESPPPPTRAHGG